MYLLLECIDCHNLPQMPQLAEASAAAERELPQDARRFTVAANSPSVANAAI